MLSPMREQLEEGRLTQQAVNTEVMRAEHAVFSRCCAAKRKAGQAGNALVPEIPLEKINYCAKFFPKFAL